MPDEGVAAMDAAHEAGKEVVAGTTFPDGQMPAVPPFHAGNEKVDLLYDLRIDFGA
jgi:hypothetical protein